jgi:hypothetical protein
MSKLGSNYATFARIPLCRACGNPYVPPGFAGCCSVRCTQYLEVARHPVLGDPLFGPQQNMLCRGGCGVRFDSHGINLCPDCFFKDRAAVIGPAEARPGSVTPEVTPVTPTPGPPTPVRHDELIIERLPRSRCHW